MRLHITYSNPFCDCCVTQSKHAMFRRIERERHMDEPVWPRDLCGALCTAHFESLFPEAMVKSGDGEPALDASKVGWEVIPIEDYTMPHSNVDVGELWKHENTADPNRELCQNCFEPAYKHFDDETGKQKGQGPPRCPDKQGYWRGAGTIAMLAKGTYQDQYGMFRIENDQKVYFDPKTNIPTGKTAPLIAPKVDEAELEARATETVDDAYERITKDAPCEYCGKLKSEHIRAELDREYHVDYVLLCDVTEYRPATPEKKQQPITHAALCKALDEAAQYRQDPPAFTEKEVTPPCKRCGKDKSEHHTYTMDDNNKLYLFCDDSEYEPDMTPGRTHEPKKLKLPDVESTYKVAMQRSDEIKTGKMREWTEEDHDKKFVDVAAAQASGIKNEGATLPKSEWKTLLDESKYRKPTIGVLKKYAGDLREISNRLFDHIPKPHVSEYNHVLREAANWFEQLEEQLYPTTTDQEYDARRHTSPAEENITPSKHAEEVLTKACGAWIPQKNKFEGTLNPSDVMQVAIDEAEYKAELARRNQRREEFQSKLAELINSLSMENESDTPDFILGEGMLKVLDGINWIIKRREQWYGRQLQVDEAVGSTVQLSKQICSWCGQYLFEHHFLNGQAWCYTDRATRAFECWGLDARTNPDVRQAIAKYIKDRCAATFDVGNLPLPVTPSDFTRRLGPGIERQRALDKENTEKVIQLAADIEKKIEQQTTGLHTKPVVRCTICHELMSTHRKGHYINSLQQHVGYICPSGAMVTEKAFVSSDLSPVAIPEVATGEYLKEQS